MAKKFTVKVDARRCKSCELCIPVCPKKIMLISDRKNELGFRVAACVDESACTGCLACAQVCPEVAIEIYREDEK
jgi:2-oxoglutarate ferredoxin oxidoreductase subunit delta